MHAEGLGAADVDLDVVAHMHPMLRMAAGQLDRPGERLRPGLVAAHLLRVHDEVEPPGQLEPVEGKVPVGDRTDHVAPRQQLLDCRDDIAVDRHALGPGLEQPVGHPARQRPVVVSHRAQRTVNRCPAELLQRALHLMADQPPVLVEVGQREPPGQIGHPLLERLDGRLECSVHHRLELPQRAVEVEGDDARGHARRNSAAAWHAAPSPRPMKPRWSVVDARTVTRSGRAPSAPASDARIASR